MLVSAYYRWRCCHRSRESEPDPDCCIRPVDEMCLQLPLPRWHCHQHRYYDPTNVACQAIFGVARQSYIVHTGYSPCPGGDNNMAVTMGVFNASKIQCRGTSGRLRSCLEVLSHMPASTTLEVFGPPGTPFVKEVLPLEIVSGKACPLPSSLRTAALLSQLTTTTMTTIKEDEQCVLKLYSTGRPDVLAWYRVWEAAEAVAALCGKDARGGSYRGLGGSFFLLFHEFLMRAEGDD